MPNRPASTRTAPPSRSRCRLGGIAWHFLLSQSFVLGNNPANIFARLTVTFQTARQVTLTTFGPPTGSTPTYTQPPTTLVCSER